MLARLGCLGIALWLCGVFKEGFLSSEVCYDLQEMVRQSSRKGSMLFNDTKEHANTLVLFMKHESFIGNDHCISQTPVTNGPGSIPFRT